MNSKNLLHAILALVLLTTFSLSVPSRAEAQCGQNGTSMTAPMPGAVSKNPNWKISLPWESSKTFRVLVGYGEGEHAKRMDLHALDFNLGLNDEVRPIANGKVVYAGSATGGWSPYGKIVFLDHENGYQTLYAHLNYIASGITAGTRVDPNRTIGGAGGTGGWQVHLHLALYKDALFYDSPTAKGP